MVSAHYDSVLGSPGANDNGTGVAALLALARHWIEVGTQPRLTLRFLLFVNEEAPFCLTNGMGSLQYARACRAKREKIEGMISLETIGYFRSAPHTQQYPFPLGLIYPITGNFIAFVANFASHRLLKRTAQAFRKGIFFL